MMPAGKLIGPREAHSLLGLFCFIFTPPMRLASMTKASDSFPARKQRVRLTYFARGELHSAEGV